MQSGLTISSQSRRSEARVRFRHVAEVLVQAAVVLGLPLTVDGTVLEEGLQIFVVRISSPATVLEGLSTFASGEMAVGVSKGIETLRQVV